MRRALVNTAALATLLASAALPSCTRADAGTDDKLVVWESYTNEEHAVFLELVARYRERFGKSAPDVVVQRVPFDGLLPKLITAAIANQTPDVCRVDVGHIGRLAYGGLAAPLDEYGVKDHLRELLPIAGESNTVIVDPRSGVGQVFGISDQLTCVALYYNKDLFAAAGLTRPPETLDELVAYAKRLTVPEKGQYGLGLNHSLWWDLPFLYLFDADVVTPDNQKPRLTEDAAAQSLTFLRQLSADGLEAGAWRAGAINPDQGFVNGRYAMVVSGAWNLQTFKAVNFGVALLPGRGANRSATNVGGTSMVVLRNSKKKKAAYELVRFLTSSEAQQLWSEKTGQFSVNLAANEARARSLSPAVRTFVEQLKYARPRPRLPNYDRLENTVNPFLLSIIGGILEPKDGLARASALMDQQVLSELKE